MLATENQKIEIAEKQAITNLFLFTTATLILAYCCKFFDNELTMAFEFVVVVYMWMGFCLFIQYLQNRKKNKYNCKKCKSWCANYTIHWYCYRKVYDDMKREQKKLDKTRKKKTLSF